MARYAIKDLEHYTGIKAHTIRIWEKRYEVVQPERSETNIRSYSDEDLKKLLNIAMLNRHGHKISDLVNLSNQNLCKMVLKLTSEKASTDLYIDNLMIATVDIDEQKFDKVLTNIIIQYGFEKAITEVFYPFFLKIGFLWQTGHIKPGQEHFISNLFRQKLISAIDQTDTKPAPNSKSFILFLPEWEMHELGLLFYHYLIKKAGHRVIYLGQQLPATDLIAISEIQKGDYYISYITIEPQPDQKEELCRIFKDESFLDKVLIGGYHAHNLAHECEKPPLTIADAEKLKIFLKNLNS